MTRLKGEDAHQTIASLMEIWRESQESTAQHAEELADVGFFENLGPKRRPVFWVPFLYQPALGMKARDRITRAAAVAGKPSPARRSG
jgi:hypothetical protein